MKLTNVSFGKKLGGAFGIILLLLVAISIMSYFSTRNIAAQAHEAETANGIVIVFGAKLADHLSWLNTLERFLADPDGNRLQLETDDHNCGLGRWLYGEDRKQAQAHFPQMAPLISKLESPHDRLHASAVKLNALFNGSNDKDTAAQKARTIYQADTLPALREVRNLMETIQEQLAKSAHGNQVQLMHLAGSTKTIIIILASIAIGMAVFFAFFMTRYVNKRANNLMEFAGTIARGDFTHTMTENGGDELGMLGSSLNQMRTKLGALLNDFVSGIAHLSASSHELFGISKEMADGSVNMSESSITVAAAAEEMSSSMHSVAAASEQASTNINMVAAAAEELTTTVSEIAQSSENARKISEEAVTTASHASTRVNDLGKAASQISKVTEVITEISEQTNLLALNATIEAARAGEAGKGFAVVANEIKELAKQTAEATQDIKSEIEGIQNTTNSTVSEINQITDVINRVNDIVSDIATAVEEQSATTQEIATNVAQASEGIQEVNVNVSQSSAVSSEIAQDIAVVSQVAGEISSSSSTVSSNAGDLSGFTVKLKDKVGEFRLPNDIATTTQGDLSQIQNRDVRDLIRWDDSIKVNVAIFDSQHKQLVGLINTLHRAMKTGQARNSVGQILSELVDYTKTHFNAEEELMREHGYEGLSKQIEEHQSLIKQVAAAQEKISSGNAMLSMDVMDFLKDWLVNHIKGEDKKYTPFFNAKGLS